MAHCLAAAEVKTLSTVTKHSANRNASITFQTVAFPVFQEHQAHQEPREAQVVQEVPEDQEDLHTQEDIQ
jgi:hypothetical protein